jgi:hypothetical protein
VPRKTSPLSSFYMPGKKTPMRPNQGKRKARETREKFFKRLQKELPVVYRVLKGNDALVADYYGIEEKFVIDMAEAYGDIREARIDARKIALAAKQDGEEVGKALEAESMRRVVEKEPLPVRKRWPRDKDKRYDAIRKFLTVDGALVSYEGDLVVLADSCNIPMSELMLMVEGDEELQALRDLGLRIQAYYLESRMLATARTSNRVNDMKYPLNNLSERWSDRKEIDHRGLDFSVPKVKELASVADIVTGRQKDENVGDGDGSTH